MKTVLTIAVEGNTHLSEEAVFAFKNQSFHFKCENDSTRIATLEITLSNVPKERWPKLTIVRREVVDSGKPAVQVSVNSKAISIADYREQLARLEGLVSLSANFRFNYSQTSQTWAPEGVQDENDFVNMLKQLNSSGQKHENYFIEANELQRAVTTAGRSNERLNSLGHFQMAQFHFESGNNLDCIRHSYFLLEQLYFPGTFKKAVALRSLQESVEFRTAFDQLDQEELTQLTTLSRKWPNKLDNNDTFNWFINFIVGLRGELQHAQKATAKQYWSPSYQDRYIYEAASLMSLIHEVCQLVRLEAYGWKNISVNA